MIHFRDTVYQNSDGRYEVSLPWKKDHALLPNNYGLSLKRLKSTNKKLEKTGYEKKYQQVFDEWIEEEVIEKVPQEELSIKGTHYLPHRPIIKEKSTTTSLKIRPVFDASAKNPNFPSLNDCLETGINFIETIPSILARFRLYEIGVISDIRRAFLQISLNERDRNYLRFLLIDEQNELKTYRHRRVVFGLTSSPFLLMAVIHHHLSKQTFKIQYSEEHAIWQALQEFISCKCKLSTDGAGRKVFVEILWEEWMSSAIMDGEKRSKNLKLHVDLVVVPVLKNFQNVMD
ncbi:uncharacterized protein [Parasteatoda tepidariorum]|uniref:uncharacterized protein n=1 Tax=Parasteatoda tepidariorum TaxID=114398 RepID=UPI001C71E155|nr:uncharacterized protein LOC122270724 [Parasteatoda tepidariorum]